MDYNFVWYFIVGFLLIGYAILDGFDLGVGTVHLLARGDEQRRILMNSIGPVWDGNEVWLVTAGGALFAAFPEVYATVFSTYYFPFMLLLVFLILRAVSLEFRSKEPAKAWRKSWDFLFFLGSVMIAFLFGFLIGNAVNGLQLDAQFEFAGDKWSLINPYSTVTGLFTVSMFAMHGIIYLGFKTEGVLYSMTRRWFWWFYAAFTILFVFVTIYTFKLHPNLMANFSFGLIDAHGPQHTLVLKHHHMVSVMGWLIVLLNFLALLNIPRMFRKQNYFMCFLSSSLLIAGLIALFALGLFPNLVFNKTNPLNNMHIYNAASSVSTLKTMFILALIGIPFVLSYTLIIYRIFRGKTKLDSSSY